MKLSVIFACLTLASMGSASACSYPDPPEFEAVAPKAKQIFVFQVLSLEYRESREGSLMSHWVEGSVRILETFRGTPKFTRIHFNNDWCGGVRLYVGHPYLIATDASADPLKLMPGDKTVLDISLEYDPLRPNAGETSPTLEHLRLALEGRGSFQDVANRAPLFADQSAARSAMSAEIVEFWFEFASTYSYPAAMRIEDVAASHGRRVVWKPFLLGPIFKAQGWDNSPFNIYPAKGRYMWRDLERTCAELSLSFVRPSVFPRNGLLAARVASAGCDSAWIGAFVRNVYTANFARDLDISQPDVVLECLRSVAPDPEAILAAAVLDDAKARLRANTERAGQLGIFGAPSFVVGQEMFWGNDRMENAMRWSGDHLEPGGPQA